MRGSTLESLGMTVRLSWFHILAGMSAVVSVIAFGSSHTAARIALTRPDVQRSDTRDGPARAASTGVYSADQSTRGQSTYVAECGRCHGDTLSGSEFGPA